MKYGPYSPSRLDVANCPYRFKREYIKKDVQDKGSEASSRGRAVHKILEWITLAWVHKRQIDPRWVNLVIDKNPLRDPENLQFVRDAAANYMNSAFPYPFETVVGVEEKVAVDIEGKSCEYDSPNAVLRGIIDILTINGEDAIIVDHKTQRNVESANTFQQGCYARMVKAAYPYLKTVTSVLHFVAPELNFYSEPYTWSDQELEDNRLDCERFIAMAENIDPETMEACPGWSCRYCPVILECPEAARFTEDGKIAKPGVIKDMDDAMMYAASLAFLEQYYDLVAKPLRDYCKRVGPVCLPSLVCEYRMSDSYNAKNKPGIEGVLRKYKIDPNKYTVFNPDSIRDIKSYFESIEDDKQRFAALLDLAQVAPETHQSRFGMFKRGKS